MTKKTLPDKPSALIRLALDDLRKVERSKRYMVDMGWWHDTGVHLRDPIKCVVCFAGAVMAGTLSVPIQDNCTPDYFDADVEAKLIALDYFRDGNVWSGVYTILDPIHKRPPSSQRRIDRLFSQKKLDRLSDEGQEVAHYKDNPGQFKKDMRKMADGLTEIGL